MTNIEYPTLSRTDTYSRLEPSKPLSDEEIDKFIDELDVDKDGNVSFAELEKRLEDVLTELSPEPQEHHLNHPDRRSRGTNSRKIAGTDPEKGEEKHHREHDGLHAFLCDLMPDCDQRTIPKHQFKQRVKSWNIPSQKQSSAENEKEQTADYRKRLTFVRRARAYWSLRGPRALFACFVGAMILGFSLWQLMVYARYTEVRAALGWGVVMAKFFAGALYPILFFMFVFVPNILDNLANVWQASQYEQMVRNCMPAILPPQSLYLSLIHI